MAHDHGHSHDHACDDHPPHGTRAGAGHVTDHGLSAHAHHQEDTEHNRSGERRTKAVVALTAMMMVGELVVGRLTNSTALTVDGWHMGTHVGALGFTLAAYWYARTRAAHDSFSFGTGKVYALAGYTSGVLLGVVAIWMLVEAIEKLADPGTILYGDALPVACLGLGVNLVSALLLGHSHHYGHSHGDHDHDHDHDHGHHDAKLEEQDRQEAQGTLDFNLRAAYIHILADAVTSLGAIVALSLGAWKGWWFLDPISGIIGSIVIGAWTISLCRQASRQLLDVVSSPLHERVVRERLEAIDDVRVADLHVWELGPGRRSCIVSVVTSSPRGVEFYRDVVLRALDVAHLTIEIHQCGLPHIESRQQVAHQHEH